MERYVIGQDFNTKDWFIYDEETGLNICLCNTKEEAEKYVNENLKTKCSNCGCNPQEAPYYMEATHCPECGHIFKYEGRNEMYTLCYINLDGITVARDYFEDLESAKNFMNNLIDTYKREDAETGLILEDSNGNVIAEYYCEL